jgi:hypothetical protein
MIIWWSFCISLFFAIRLIPNEKIKLTAIAFIIVLMMATKPFSIYTISLTVAICFFLSNKKQIVTIANIFVLHLFCLCMVLYLKFTSQSIAVFQPLYLLLWVLLIIRIGIAIISSYSKTTINKFVSVVSVAVFTMGGIFLLTSYILPLFRNLFTWFVSLVTLGIGWLIGPLYQLIAELIENKMSTKQLIPENNEPDIVLDQVGKVLPKNAYTLQQLWDTQNKILILLLVIVISYGSYRLVKSLRKIKLQSSPKNEVSVNWIEEPSIPSDLEPIEYSDEIDKLVNKIFIHATESGAPKEENQSIRKWASTLPFQIPEDWLKDFENIRYNDTTNKQVRSSFIHQSLKIIENFNQINKINGI